MIDIPKERQRIEADWKAAKETYDAALETYAAALWDLQENFCPHTRRKPSESILDEQVAQCLDCGKRLTGGLKP